MQVLRRVTAPIVLLASLLLACACASPVAREIPEASYHAENEYMETAIDEARSGIYNGDGGPFGSVIVKGDTVIGRGHNSVLSKHDSTCHGEIVAIRDAEARLGTHDLSGCVIYTTGEPCPMCLTACMWANIDHVYYGCTIEDNASIGFRDVLFDEVLGGRAGVAWGVLDSSLMPTNEREGILETKPSGWNPAKYDELIEDGFLYNRCHLIGFQLTGENDNPLNLMTGTRYFNVEGMLPFENKVAGYIRREDGRIFYRVTPLFQGNEQLARYLRMEAYSLDDHGVAVCFDVLVYNVQPGITIDYSTGESHRSK